MTNSSPQLSPTGDSFMRSSAELNRKKRPLSQLSVSYLISLVCDCLLSAFKTMLSFFPGHQLIGIQKCFINE